MDTPSMSRVPILQERDLRRLQASGQVGPRTGRGSRFVNPRLFETKWCPYTDPAFGHLNLRHSNPLGTSAGFVEIPEFLESRATLLYLGYTQQAASELWDEWVHIHRPSSIIDFEDFITKHIYQSPEVENCDDAQFRAWLDSVGINTRPHDYVMGPNDGLTENCGSKVVDTTADTVHCRFLSLQGILEDSDHREFFLMLGPQAGRVSTAPPRARL